MPCVVDLDQGVSRRAQARCPKEKRGAKILPSCFEAPKIHNIYNIYSEPPGLLSKMRQQKLQERRCGSASVRPRCAAVSVRAPAWIGASLSKMRCGSASGCPRRSLKLDPKQHSCIRGQFGRMRGTITTLFIRRLPRIELCIFLCCDMRTTHDFELA